MDQGDGGFRGPTRELTLAHVAHVPNLGNHNMTSMKRLTRVFAEPMCIYPAAAVIRPRRGGKPLIFRSLHRENGLLETRVCCLDHTKTRTAKPSALSSLVAAKRNQRGIMEFSRVLGHPSREITRETACMAGVQLSRIWSLCIYCSESKVRKTLYQNSPRAGRIGAQDGFLLRFQTLSIKLSAWVEASHGTCPNTRRSVLGEGGYDGQWHHQLVIASSKSKYMALAEIVKRAAISSASEGVHDAPYRHPHQDPRK